jgi:MYND finger
MALLNTTDNITIRYVRGKYVISTMQEADLVFGQANTLLECPTCMRDATWRGVLIGPCEACSYIYDGYDIGFPEKKYPHSMPCGSIAAPFGFYCGVGREVCRKIDALLAEGIDHIIPPNAQHIKHEDAYSFYGAASLCMDITLMIESLWGTHNIGLRYNCECDSRRLTSIIRVMSELSSEFDTSLEFYKKCEKMEKEWIECSDAITQEEVDSEMSRKKMVDKKTNTHECHYCGNIEKTMLCGECKSVRYCSVACQHRDWTKGGAYTCANGEPSDPHKASCAYLTGLRKNQENYEKMNHDEPEYEQPEYDEPEYE